MNDPNAPVGFRSLKFWLTITALIAYGILTTVFCNFKDPRQGLMWLQVLNYFTFVLAVLALVRPWKTRAITALLIAAFVWLAPAPKARATPAACAIAVVVIVVGVVIVVELRKLCKLLPPPNGNPPNPPNNPTNSPPDPWPDQRPATPRIMMSDDNIYAYAFNFAQTDPIGYPYYAYIKGALDSSTDIAHWKRECSFEGWSSGAYMLTLYRDTNGVPFLTNLIAFSAATNNLPPCVVCPTTEPKKFFRLTQ